MEMYLTTEDHYITFEGGGNIVHHPMEEGVMMDQSQAALIWSWNFDDDVIDVFKAICKALDLYNEEPGLAYKQGLAEGRAEVYKEWKDSFMEHWKPVFTSD